jgi:DNA-binding NarL/FixJ family response regulator
MTPPKKLVVLVDDHPIVALGLKTVLNETTDFSFVTSATDAAQALVEAERLKPDLLVLDLVLPGRGGLELIPELQRVSPQTKIVVFSSLPELTYAPRALRAGARGFVGKESGLLLLVEALRRTSEGGTYATESVKQAILDNYGRAGNSQGKNGFNHLSNQELNVFRLIGAGLRLSEIAEKLGISPKTVGTHRERIKSKLALRSGKELDQEALRFTESSQVPASIA